MFLGSNRHHLIVVSMLTALTMSACGKKKEVYGSSSKKTAATQAQGQIKKDLPAPNVGSSTGDLPGPTGKPNTGGGTIAAPGATTPPPLAGNGPTLPAVTDARPVQPLDLNPIPQDYKPSNASHLEKDGISKKITGGQTSEGLLYTSTSVDNIHAYLRSRNEKVSWGQKRLNMEVAASVQKAKLVVDSLSGEATVIVKMMEGGAENTYVLTGSMGEGSAQTLKLVRAGGNEKTTGRRGVEATIKCLDLDGQCENSFARLKFNVDGVSAVANIVFRQSLADIYFHLPGEYTDNPEYIQMREFVHNSIKRVNTDNKIKSITMSSWEVANGRSGFELLVRGGNKELLGFAGPLLAPEAGTAVNVTLSRIGKENTDSLDLLSLGNVRLNLANSIQEARLINNNGVGQIRIALKMRKRGEYAQDQFAMTVMRRVKPLIDLTEESLK